MTSPLRNMIFRMVFLRFSRLFLHWHLSRHYFLLSPLAACHDIICVLSFLSLDWQPVMISLPFWRPPLFASALASWVGFFDFSGPWSLDDHDGVRLVARWTFACLHLTPGNGMFLKTQSYCSKCTKGIKQVAECLRRAKWWLRNHKVMFLKKRACMNRNAQVHVWKYTSMQYALNWQSLTVKVQHLVSEKGRLCCSDEFLHSGMPFQKLIYAHGKTGTLLKQRLVCLRNFWLHAAGCFGSVSVVPSGDHFMFVRMGAARLYSWTTQLFAQWYASEKSELWLLKCNVSFLETCGRIDPIAWMYFGK